MKQSQKIRDITAIQAIKSEAQLLKDENRRIVSILKKALKEEDQTKEIRSFKKKFWDGDRWVLTKETDTFGFLKTAIYMESYFKLMLAEEAPRDSYKMMTLNSIKTAKSVNYFGQYIREDWDPVDKLMAVNGLNDICDPRANEFLLKAMRDEDQDTCLSAVDGLLQYKNDRTIEVFMSLLKDESWWVRSKAAWALGEFEESKAVKPLVSLLLDRDESGNVQVAAIGALGESGLVN